MTVPPSARVAGADARDPALRPALRVRRRGRQRPRRVVLHGVMPGRRYVVGKGESCGHPGRGHLRQPAPCRGLARERRLVGRRRRLDQRRARRAGRRRCSAAPRRRRRRARRRSGWRTGCASSSRRAPRDRRATTRGARPPRPPMVTPTPARRTTHAATAILAARVAPTDDADARPAGGREETRFASRRRRPAACAPCRSPRRAAGERRPLAPPDAGGRPPPRRRVGSSPRRSSSSITDGALRSSSTATTACRSTASRTPPGDALALAAGREDGARRRLARRPRLHARPGAPPASTEMTMPFSLRAAQPGDADRAGSAAAGAARASRAALGARVELQHRLRPHRRRGRVVLRQPARIATKTRTARSPASGAAVRRRRRRRRRGDGADREPRARRPPAWRPRRRAVPMPPRVRRAMLGADRAIASRIAQVTASPGAATVAMCAPINAAGVEVADRLGRRLPRLPARRARGETRFELLTRDDTFRQLDEAPPDGGSPDDPARMVGNGATTGANVARARPRLAASCSLLCSDGVHKHLDADRLAPAC